MTLAPDNVARPMAQRDPSRRTRSFRRRAIPVGLGLVLAVVYGVVMSVAGAGDGVRLAVGLPLFTAFLAWAGAYAVPSGGGASSRGQRS